ncbi:tRNA (adenosine(37)-N6)-dimethylallyltransferase MiaA [Hallella colorans]|uniref:tRNA (adenosine(37)-N6)-dimethylallyltransferase MiaA n=1 Tax=Hallella colorans TaxID=1703337 RepID=UPI0023EFDFC5|nr:tRNA (adenosine(37)-N6)-dimethylallyltransferase MiaA [Hallella colorans]
MAILSPQPTNADLSNKPRTRLITILGPTACGKTALAVALANELGSEIISADSRQVYRGMDIGTGKDLEDYVVDGKRVPYHLIDIVKPGSKYNLYRYQRDFMAAYDDIVSRGAQPILCGGTGLYIEAVLKGYALSTVPQNPALRKQLEGESLETLTQKLVELKKKNNSNMHNTTDVDSCQRAIRAIEIETYNLERAAERRPAQPVDAIVFGLDIDREERRRKISERLRQRLDNGMVDEIKRLLDSGVAPVDLIYYGLEYKYVTEYVVGKLSFDEMYRQLEIAIHQFAKRQMTWFRGMERRGTDIHWLDAALCMEKKINEIKRML